MFISQCTSKKSKVYTTMYACNTPHCL